MARGLLDQRAKERSRLAAVDVKQHGLDRADRRGRERERTVADRGQRQGAERLRREFTADGRRLVVHVGLIRNVPESSQNRCRQGIETVRHAWVAAVDRVKKLHQIVGTDGEEVNPLQKLIELVKERRDLHHAADLDFVRQFVAMAAKVCQFPFDQFLGLVEFLHRRNHGEHDL